MRALHLLALAPLAVAACGGGPITVGEYDDGMTVCAKGTTVKGIDVSHWDGTIDWTKVKGDGVEFAFMKATEGTTFVDPQFATNWAGAKAAGVIPGAYHFLRPADDPVQQADFFLQTAGVPVSGELPLTLDLEVTDGLSGAAVAQNALAFLQRVAEKSGRTPIVYTSNSFFNGTLGGPSGFDPYTLWDANWQVTCPNIPDPPWSDWAFWQYTDAGTIAGITGSANVDVNQWNGTLAELQAFVTVSASSDGNGAQDAGTVGDATMSSSDATGAQPDATSAPPDLLARFDLARTPLKAQTDSGCGCAVGARSDGDLGGIAALGLLALVVIARRRLMRSQ